jgi:hypothetical protein
MKNPSESGRRTRTPAAQTSRPKRKSHEVGEDVKHVVNTGLPPGISVDEALDPGSQARKRSGGKPA